MRCVTLMWGSLLLSGLLVINTYAGPSTTTPSKASIPSNKKSITTTTTTAPPTTNTTHTTANTIHTTSNVTTPGTSNTTSPPPTHKTPSLPPNPSPPQSGTYKVGNEKGLCIIAEMGLELEVQNATKYKFYFNLNPENITVNGTCGENEANLFLKFPEGFINFVFVKDSKVYFIDEVSVNFTWEGLGIYHGIAKKQNLLRTDTGYSVKCTNTPAVNLADDLQLTLAAVKLQAFDIHNGTLSKDIACSYDRNLIAVAIGVSVLAVIIVGIIVYFVCLKRKSSGYQRI
ncbi:lysosome-associated membrane glycoprotein 3 isoform X2 [Hyperolius riggenbachi]|uniref:lysosome-associated membrane glycoprotein 3 isoform X2 n=1 Tax=Hyperolius riggenbachi TaxID=752182 RepID=UPI0035A3179D